MFIAFLRVAELEKGAKGPAGKMLALFLFRLTDSERQFAEAVRQTRQSQTADKQLSILQNATVLPRDTHRVSTDILSKI